MHIFGDWATPIKLAICHQSGFNVFYPSSCLNYPFNYGNLLLYTPIFKPLENFYFYYLPLTLGFVFIYTIVKLIDRKKLLNIALLILIILKHGQF